MTTECSSTPEAISGILLAGDAVLNLSDQDLKCVGSTRFLKNSGESLNITTAPAQVRWRADFAHSLVDLPEAEVNRVVVVSDSAEPRPEEALTALRDAGITHVHCTLTSGCDADAFMDEEDAEAVAERLRQLGYL